MKGNGRWEPRGSREARSGHRRIALLACYALWVALVLSASTPYLAETGTRKVLEDGTFSYGPTFDNDGPIEHYIVERADKSGPGSIEIAYDEDTKVVQVQADNIVELTVDCRSIAKEKNREILGDDWSDQDLVHQYFTDLQWLSVHTSTSHSMQITWKHMPVPKAVVADDEEYVKDWNRDGSDIEILAPQGDHHYILFFIDLPRFPTAVIEVEHTVTLVNDELVFDGSRSIGGDGELEKITDYLWDFDTSDDSDTVTSGAKVRHAFSSTGTFTVSLTVRNGYGMKNTATQLIKVDTENSGIDLDGDGKPDWSDDDMDGDGVTNVVDDFPEDPGADTDTDGDGLPDDLTGESTTGLTADDDDDNDGVTDLQDGDPTDPEVGAVGGEKETEKESGGMDMTLILLILVIIVVIVVIAAAMRARSGKEEEEPVQEDTMGEWVDIKGYGESEKVNEGKKGKKMTVAPGKAKKEEKPDRISCPSCGASVKADSGSCMFCGASVAATEDKTSREKPSKEEPIKEKPSDGGKKRSKKPPKAKKVDGAEKAPKASRVETGPDEAETGETEEEGGGGGPTECPVCAAPLATGAEECPDCGEDLTGLGAGGDDDWGGGKDDWGE